MTIILLQIFAFGSSLSMAYFNMIPVRKMREHGASIQEEKEYHAANFSVLGWLNIALTFSFKEWEWIAAVLLAALWQWMTFDICLNIFTDKSGFYVGETAKTDKLLRKHLGRYAGQIKAGVCLIVIIALNILYYTL
jgi:hypothetical protein